MSKGEIYCKIYFTSSTQDECLDIFFLPAAPYWWETDRGKENFRKTLLQITSCSKTMLVAENITIWFPFEKKVGAFSQQRFSTKYCTIAKTIHKVVITLSLHVRFKLGLTLFYFYCVLTSSCISLVFDRKEQLQVPQVCGT